MDESLLTGARNLDTEKEVPSQAITKDYDEKREVTRLLTFHPLYLLQKFQTKQTITKDNILSIFKLELFSGHSEFDHL